MGKVLVWIVIIVAVLLVLRIVNVKAARKAREAAAPPPGNEPRALMVKCTECGIYLPKAEAREGPRGPCCGDEACRERARQSR
jgi:uncharacterized protein